MATTGAMFLLLALASMSLRASGQPWQLCGTTGNYMANSTYQSNLASLATALPAKAASQSQSGKANLFAASSVGSVPDTVNGLALCRGDINRTACGSCVATAFQDAQQLCAYRKDAAVFYDDCYLWFSNRNILASSSVSGELFTLVPTRRNASSRSGGDDYVAVVVSLEDFDAVILMNSQNVSDPVVPFDAAVGALLTATPDYAATDSAMRFATGAEKTTIYGMAQCTPDMAPDSCRSCLSRIITVEPEYLSGRKGGRIIGLPASTGTRCTPSSPAHLCFICQSHPWAHPRRHRRL